jgi:hypothetical protein
VRCAWQRSGFWFEGLDEQPAGRFAAEEVIGRGPAAAPAGDRHHPAAQSGRPDVPLGPRRGGCGGGGGAGVAGEIHGSGIGFWLLLWFGADHVGPLLQQAHVKGGSAPPPSVDAPGAAGEELGAGDLLAGLDRRFDRGLVGFGGGGDGEPLGIEAFLVVDLDGLGLAGSEFVVGEAEPGGLGLQAGEHQHQGGLQVIGAAVVAGGQSGEALGLLLAIGGLASEVLDHPAGGIGLGGDGGLVGFIGEQCGFQFAEGELAFIRVVGFQPLGQLGDGGGELLGLDAQLPKRAGALDGAGRTRGAGLNSCGCGWSSCQGIWSQGDGCEDSHGCEGERNWSEG